MGDLFDQLKTSGPVKKSSFSPAKSSSNKTSKHKFTKTVEAFNEKHKSKSGSIRRESMPSPITVSSVLKKSKSHKARSLSPPKYGANNAIKSLKVKLERKKLEEFLTRPLEEHASNIRNKQEKIKDSHKQPKMTPTKAQQKLFEPPSVREKKKKSKAQVLKEFNIKPCKVRIHRDNLKKLAKQFRKKPATTIQTNKRPASESLAGPPPVKKGKFSVSDTKSSKIKNNFFIKLNTSPSSKLEKKLKNLTKTPSSSSVAQHNKIKNSKFNTITTPTKFSRTQLIGSFGKRFFNVQVKIERCTHPLMLTFESNDRARRKAKRNKSKNLSVSFREQVEIFGDSTDSDDSCDEDFKVTPSRNKNNNKNSHRIPIPTTPIVMPARLKKVENGKVVEDIVLEPSLFIDPKTLVSSTPFSPGRKKRDHKSFSPLKDESSPSPRKEKLKLANERVPPTGLRRLNIEEEDDEDDDCEYIVPIELPQRRASHASSNPEFDDIMDTSLPIAESTINFGLFNDDGINDNLNLKKNTLNSPDKAKGAASKGAVAINLENGSDDSFQSARDVLEKQSETRNQLTEFGLGNFGVSSGIGHTNGNGLNESSKHLNTINTMEDISMNLFMEDSQTNEEDTNAKSFVDSLINETIDKLSKDIDEGSTD